MDGLGELILLALGFTFLILLPLAFIGIVGLFLIYLFSYDWVRNGDYEDARTPTLVFAILSMITLAVVPGILYLIAYAKLGDAIREEPSLHSSWASPPPQPPTASFAAEERAVGARRCALCGRANLVSATYCQGCGSPLVWNASSLQPLK